jgi:hypothetical protein
MRGCRTFNGNIRPNGRGTRPSRARNCLRLSGAPSDTDILDPPSRSRRGFEQRMQHLTDILEALISQHEDSSHS